MAMRVAPWHQYIILTKRPGYWMRYDLPADVWKGVTIEDVPYAWRWDVLTGDVRSPKSVRLVSIEPMLGPVALSMFSPLPDWVICGPETGTGARPCDPAWIEALAADCLAAGHAGSHKCARGGWYVACGEETQNAGGQISSEAR